MGKSLSQRIAAAALSLMVIAAASGCAGPMRRPGGRAGTRPGGVTQGGLIGGGTTTPRLGGMAGAPGTTGFRGTTAGTVTFSRMDLGQEISAFIAGLSVLNGGTAGTSGPAGTTAPTGTTGTVGTGVSVPGATSGTAGSTGGMVGATGGMAGAGTTAGTTGTAGTTAGTAGTPVGTTGTVTGTSPWTPGTTVVGMGRRVGVSTLIIGNTAYVGLDPTTMSVAWTGNTTGFTPGTAGAGAPGTVGTTGTTGTAGVTGVTTLESYIRSRVLVQFPQLADVIVTTNPRHVHRIARIHGEMLGGVPATRRMTEIMMIVREITPAGR